MWFSISEISVKTDIKPTDDYSENAIGHTPGASVLFSALESKSKSLDSNIYLNFLFFRLNKNYIKSTPVKIENTTWHNPRGECSYKHDSALLTLDTNKDIDSPDSSYQDTGNYW